MLPGSKVGTQKPLFFDVANLFSPSLDVTRAAFTLQGGPVGTGIRISRNAGSIFGMPSIHGYTSQSLAVNEWPTCSRISQARQPPPTLKRYLSAWLYNPHVDSTTLRSSICFPIRRNRLNFKSRLQTETNKKAWPSNCLWKVWVYIVLVMCLHLSMCN